jgi:DNA-binding response OmpR family regulator
MRVPITDCDSEFLDIAQRFMNQCGHEAFVASSGLECIACLRDCPPDVLALSCELLWGGTEGILGIMDEEPTLDAIPVILVTDEEPEPKRVFEANSRVFDRVNKPYSLSQLLKQMQLCEVIRPGSTVRNRLLRGSGGKMPS